MNKAILSIDIPHYKLLKRGKVRSLYELDRDKILIVASDRISAFDVVLPSGIPNKGIILTQLSNFWFDYFSSSIKHHLISKNIEEVPNLSQDLLSILGKRSVIVKKTKVLPFECIVRGYITGSLWRSYCSGKIHSDYSLEPQLKESDRLTEPLFTPTTKAEHGHDEEISEREMANLIGKEITTFLKEKSIEIYLRAHDYAQKRGVILADTKMEFGIFEDEPILIDELLTPDSSRFWEKQSYSPGQAQTSFDKQFVRDYLESISWAKKPPAPLLPDQVIEMTQNKYLEAYRMLTGQIFQL